MPGQKKKLCLRPLACFFPLCREQRARPRLPVPAQRHPAQPLPQQPGAGAQRQGDPAGHRRSRRLHAPHLRARARRPRRSVLPAAHQRSATSTRSLRVQGRRALKFCRSAALGVRTASREPEREKKKYQTRLYVFMFKYSENKCEKQICVSVGSEIMGWI